MKSAISNSIFAGLRMRKKLLSNIYKIPSSDFAFTIVELLVVIVVIGILAAITIVSYTSISGKATVASLQSDLSSASKLLKMYYADYGVYPVISSTTNCPTSPTVNNRYCLKPSTGSTFTYYPNETAGVTSSPNYNLSATNNTTTYTTTNNSGIISPAPLSPVADWLALPQGDHYGNYYDLITKNWATVTRTTPKTIYDPNAKKIYDVPVGYLAINPRSDGKSGSEAVIEEARTNQAYNSNFETDSNNDGIPDSWADVRSYWTGSGSETASSSESIYGQKSFRMERTSSTGQLWSSPTIYLENGQTYAFSCYVKANGVDAGLDSYDGISWSTARVQSSQLNIWTKLSTVFTHGGTTGLYGGDRFRITISGSSGATTAYFDACQMEKGTFATSYVPTTNTAVTRNADNVTVSTTNWGANAGTLVAEALYSNNAVVDSNKTDSLIEWYGNSSNLINLLYQYGGIRFAGYANGNWFNIPMSASYLYHVVAGSYSSVNYVYVDGVKSSSSVANLPTGLGATATIGYGFTGYANTPIQRLSVYSAAISDADVMTATNAIKDGP